MQILNLIFTSTITHVTQHWNQSEIYTFIIYLYRIYHKTSLENGSVSVLTFKITFQNFDMLKSDWKLKTYKMQTRTSIFGKEKF